MVIKKSVVKIVTLLMAMVMVFGSVTAVFADVPAKEEIEYKGGGKVEVEFHGKVNWKNTTVTVKDSTGKSYATKIVKQDNDDITFLIKNYKPGMKYTFKISGAKARGTTGYGTVKGSVKIPAEKKAATVKTVARNTAKNTAIKNATSAYKLTKSTVRDLDIEKDTYRGKKVWEVSFEGKRSGKKGWFEFEYKIDVNTGKILAKKVERD